MYSLDTDTTLRLIQITDTHLSELEGGHLLGMQTLHSLVCVLDLVQKNHAIVDAMLVTGDLSQDGSIESYKRLQDALGTLPYPSFWLPGNHDEPDAMAVVTSGTRLEERVLRSQHWQVVLLNSRVAGKVYGFLEDSELQILRDALASADGRYSLICFHHHPVDMQSRWIDQIGIRNADALMAVVQQYPHVRVLLWGHVHQESDQLQNGIRLLSTPSTCVQFEPHTENFSVDSVAPGYRWIDLHNDGSISTGVNRVCDIEFEVDYSVKGY
ncbi:3',5'-cyclic-AMP phosphodiesterase [Parathalassolituus penaei]|uniref:3',5'-cyclic-AMP phosphodiesterase n=1 Tax=Parathalassolituus penaei TaxID=2997323 RepID=A0A9X3EMC6_9GAMM|nr:3',5'-cyclic-AMP phosphodiesterase [Parathalassolituus penaei]MCY0965308.1 3',5'-cyclic-AMP phosphodiesterase [Parathalassolituus penaei]